MIFILILIFVTDNYKPSSSVSVGFFALISFIPHPILSTLTNFILSFFKYKSLVIEDMTKPFNIKKAIIVIDNINIKIYTNDTI